MGPRPGIAATSFSLELAEQQLPIPHRCLFCNQVADVSLDVFLELTGDSDPHARTVTAAVRYCGIYGEGCRSFEAVVQRCA